MRAKHAQQIRYGIELARMDPDDAAGPLGSILLPRLTIKAYVREDNNVLKRTVFPLDAPGWISQPETTDREESADPDSMHQSGEVWTP